MAPPSSAVNVTFFVSAGYPYTTYTRHTRAGVDGAFGLDTSDLPLKKGNGAELKAIDADGNVFHLSFTIQGWQAFLPMLPFGGGR